jgi:hypothetical protein
MGTERMILDGRKEKIKRERVGSFTGLYMFCGCCSMQQYALDEFVDDLSKST